MTDTQKIPVLLFAVLREKASTSTLDIEVPQGETTVAGLLSACAMQYPGLAPWLPYVKVAVNCAYATSETVIQPSDEIALLPPVAGGA